jgi:hypothetical protein
MRTALLLFRHVLHIKEKAGMDELDRHLASHNEDVHAPIVRIIKLLVRNGGKTIRKKFGGCKMIIMIFNCSYIRFRSRSMLNVVVEKTQIVKRCHMFCGVIFKHELFGATAAEQVLRYIIRRYAYKNVLVPRKILRSLDLVINGGIDYSEALHTVDALESYQHGNISCFSSIQQCAAQLHDLGQEIVPVRWQECAL